VDPASGSAQDTKPREQQVPQPRTSVPEIYEGSYALLVGVPDYDFLRTLPGVRDEMKMVRPALEQQGFIVTELLNPMTRKEVRDAVEQFIENYGLKPRNRLLFYFAGHGFTQKEFDGREIGYFATKGAIRPWENYELFRKHAVSTDDIDSYARNVRSKHVLFVFNSCYSASMIRRGDPSEISIQQAIEQPVRHFITAGTDNQEVFDKGPFPTAFVEGMAGEANRNDDGYVTASELGSYIHDRVADLLPKLQTPYQTKIKDEKLDKGEFVFEIKNHQAKRTLQYWLKEAEAAYKNKLAATLATAADEALKLDQTNYLAHFYKMEAIYRNEEDEKEDKKKARPEANEVISLLQVPRTARELWARGGAYRMTDQTDRALDDFNRAILADPKFSLAYLSRSDIFLKQKKYAQAIADANKAISLDPDFWAAYFALGNVYLDKGDWRTAVNHFESGIQKGKKYLSQSLADTLNVSTVMNSFDASMSAKSGDKFIASIFMPLLRDMDNMIIHQLHNSLQTNPRIFSYIIAAMKIEDTPKAIEILSEAINKERDYILLYFFRSDLYFDINKTDLRLKDLNEITLLNPKLEFPYVIRAYLYDEKGNKDKALEEINRGLEATTSRTNFLIFRIFIYDDLIKKPDLALQDLSAAISHSPQNAFPYFIRGSLHLEKERFDSAIQDFTKALELTSNEGRMYRERAWAYFRKGETEAALRDLDQAIRWSPDDKVAYWRRGVAYTDADNFDLAIKDFDQALKLDPKYTIAYARRGWSHHRSKDYQSSIRDFTEAIKLDPTLAEAFHRRGLSRTALKEYKLAIEDFSAAIKLNYTLSYSTRGQCYVDTGQYDQAIKDLVKALSIEDDWLDRDYLGVAYFEKKKYDQAIAEFSRAIEMAPDKAFLYDDRARAYVKIGNPRLASIDEILAQKLREGKKNN
jgi:tetratricopeptide (TPR) repeat protein